MPQGEPRRIAALDHRGEPTLEHIEARRTHLWVVAFVVMGGLAGLLLMAPATAAGSTSATSAPVRVGLLLLVTAFGAYVVEKERHLRAVLRQLVEERQRAEALAEEANHDPLTGLLNHATFRHRLDAALAGSKRHGDTFALLLADIDRFRALNQRHGSAACDRALVEVGRRMAEVVRADDAVARLRSDEFAVLLERVSHTAGVAEVAQRVLDVLARPFDDLPGLPGLTASVGVVVHAGGEKEQVSDLVRDAELAQRLARGKQQSRIEIFDRTHPDQPQGPGKSRR